MYAEQYVSSNTMQQIDKYTYGVYLSETCSFVLSLHLEDFMETMMAVFNDTAARDNAVATAKGNPRIDLLYAGDAKPVLNGALSDAPARPFVIFRGDMMGGLHFMQHGAMSSGIV